MAWRRDAREFYQKWEDANWNLCTLADDHGIARTTVTNWKRRHARENPDWFVLPEYVNAKGNFKDKPSRPKPPPLVQVTDKEVRLEGDFAVSSDWHAPLIDYDVFNRFLDDAHRNKLTRCIIAGDLTNQDALAGHEEKQEGAELEPEMEHLEYAVTQALEVFQTLHVSLGNHDRHTARNVKVTFERSIRMLLANLDKEKLDRIQVTARDYFIVETERGPWRVCHTRSYSRDPLKYPNRLALRWGMHIAGGHRHHHAQGVSANGYDIAELGGLMDPDLLAYSHRYTNDLPIMVPGYGLLVDGFMRCPMLWS